MLPGKPESGRANPGKGSEQPMDWLQASCAVVGILAGGLYIADYIGTKRKAAHMERPNRTEKRG